MYCAACGKRIVRRQRCLILAAAQRLRLGVTPKGSEVVCCSLGCGCRVLTGDVFQGDLRRVPDGTFWPWGCKKGASPPPRRR